jgi:hypothetical protein
MHLLRKIARQQSWLHLTEAEPLKKLIDRSVAGTGGTCRYGGQLATPVVAH